eukprot:460110-Heterocapsa_arctica.AAC.1
MEALQRRPSPPTTPPSPTSCLTNPDQRPDRTPSELPGILRNKNVRPCRYTSRAACDQTP